MRFPPIKIGRVLPVRHALQGHSESPCLWDTMIHNILMSPSIGFKGTTHNPCLYNGRINGGPIFLLRQVDGFSVAAPHTEAANTLFTLVQKGLTQPLKRLGILTMFNGLDIIQGNRFIKLSCKIYLTKIMKGHGWIRPTHSLPLSPPMNYNKKYMKEL